MEADDFLWAINELGASDAEERRHIERIHILFTTAIIASYFSPIAQEMVSNQDIRFYTDSLIIISFAYLILRLVDVTVPIRNFHTILDAIFGVIAPLGFLISILGYSALAFISIFNINISPTQLALIAVTILITSYQLARIRRQEETKEENLGEVFGKGIEFEDFVYNNPERVEPGLRWESREKNVGGIHAPVDLIGEDSEGNRVYGELKIGEVGSSRARYVVDMLSELSDNGRVILITNGSVTSVARDMFESNSIEIKTVQMD